MTQKVDHLSERHVELDKRHSENLEIMKQWIEYFNKRHEETDSKFQIVVTYVKQLRENIDKNQKMNEEFIKKVIDEYVEIPQVDKNKLKEEILNELNYVKTTLKDEKITDIVQKTDELSRNLLTNSEKWLINILFNSTEPMTYEQIVGKTGKSLNTIRVYMNSLKNKGSIIEETTLPNGTKVFAVSNKERVKKLYNVNSF
jgi:predicted RNA-binding protein YlqC (UPF0109 family)